MLDTSDSFNMRVLEAMHLPKMQTGDDWKGNRHGSIPEEPPVKGMTKVHIVRDIAKKE